MQLYSTIFNNNQFFVFCGFVFVFFVQNSLPYFSSLLFSSCELKLLKRSKDGAIAT